MHGDSAYRDKMNEDQGQILIVDHYACIQLRSTLLNTMPRIANAPAFYKPHDYCMESLANPAFLICHANIMRIAYSTISCGITLY